MTLGETQEPQTEQTAFGWQRRLLIAVCFWSLLGFFDANQTYFLMLNQGMHHSWLRIASWTILCWNFWTPMTPVVFRLGARYPIERGTLTSIPIHLGAAIVSAATHVLLIVSLGRMIRPFDVMTKKTDFLQNYISACTGMVPLIVLVYAAVLSTSYALDYREKYIERKFRAGQLETRLLQAQLCSLKAQLQPHFLFNTLNGISALINDHDSKTANKMLIALSQLLRYTRETSGRKEVTLQEDLDFLERYIEIEEMRFEDRLRVTIDVEPDTLQALVPSLFLQPLVENAIRHGVGPRLTPGTVSLTAQRIGSKLELIISDDGVGLPEGWDPDENKGIGLNVTRDRLRLLYGTEHRFIVAPREQGVDVCIQIPYRITEAAI